MIEIAGGILLAALILFVGIPLAAAFFRIQRTHWTSPPRSPVAQLPADYVSAPPLKWSERRTLEKVGFIFGFTPWVIGAAAILIGIASVLFTGGTI